MKQRELRVPTSSATAPRDGLHQSSTAPVEMSIVAPLFAPLVPRSTRLTRSGEAILIAGRLEFGDRIDVVNRERRRDRNHPSLTNRGDDRWDRRATKFVFPQHLGGIALVARASLILGESATSHASRHRRGKIWSFTASAPHSCAMRHQLHGAIDRAVVIHADLGDDQNAANLR